MRKAQLLMRVDFSKLNDLINNKKLGRVGKRVQGGITHNNLCWKKH